MADNVELAGKVAVITGASAGIGQALARQLADAGVRLGLGSRRAGADDADDSIQVRCDVRDPQQVSELVRRTVERFGALDILVANAGVGSYGPFLDVPEAHIEEMIDTNVKGTINLLRAGLPHLMERGGDVITVASEAGRRGLPNEAVYCASKFAQVGLTASLDHELREHDIRCTAICPGGVATEFALDDNRGRTPEQVANAGMMTAEDIADVIVYTLRQPRRLRLLEVAMRPMSEASMG